MKALPAIAAVIAWQLAATFAPAERSSSAKEPVARCCCCKAGSCMCGCQNNAPKPTRPANERVSICKCKSLPALPLTKPVQIPGLFKNHVRSTCVLAHFATETNVVVRDAVRHGPRPPPELGLIQTIVLLT